jgi:potassium large conductance calcium-activated channel subfamily M alpha protein 1
MAMNRPPLQICDKLDPSIIEWQRYGVYKHLKNSMLNVVKLSVLHVLVCIQGKWLNLLFYFILQM